MTGGLERHEGDAAFEACFAEHAQRLLAFALRRVDGRAVAEDVVADTFAVAWRRRDDIPDLSLPVLYAIANRVIANQRRSSRRLHRLRGRLSQERSGPGRDPAEVASERDAILLAFARLSERQREVLRLAAWEGLEAADAATVLGCSTTAFRVRLHRARRELEKHLGPAGHEPDERSVAPQRLPTAEEIQ